LIHTLYVSLILKIAVPGWASLMVAILFLGSVQLITLGILGSYLARNYDESRNRPLYLIQKKEGF
jgi:dolichol-phosphate mannosyltransferase